MSDDYVRITSQLCLQCRAVRDFLVGVMGTKPIEVEVSDGGGGRVSDAQRSGECGCSDGGGGNRSGVSGVSQCNGIVANAGVVLPDAGEG